MPCKKISKKNALITIWIGISVFIVTVVLIAVFPTIYSMVLKKKITLTKGSLVTSVWQDIPLPIYENVYFFNITNSDMFVKGLEPLNVVEVGPYTYKSRWVKKHPHWHSNGTVTYKEVRTYQFIPAHSNGTLDDTIYTLNGPMILAASIAKSYPEILRAALSVILGIEGEDVVIKRKVRELTYEGYEDLIIKYAPYIKPDVPFKEGKFCWLYGKNATNDGAFTVFTGEGDASKTDMINNWNGEERLNFWKGDTCNMLNGTSIETGPPVTADQTNYTFFQSIFCRSLTFKYTEDTTHYGIPAKRFRPTSDLFANGTQNPDNYCFDINEEHASGVLDISPCQYGAPIFISFPHFYMADPSYLRSVRGLHPNDEQHGSYIDVELRTGVSIYLSIKFQINVEIQDVEGIFQLSKVPKGILPVLWVDLNLKIDEYFADYLKSHMKTPKIIAYSVFGGLAGLSLLLSVCCFVVICSCGPEDDDECLIDAREDIARIHQNENRELQYGDDYDEKLLDSDTTSSRKEASGVVNSTAEDYGPFTKP